MTWNRSRQEIALPRRYGRREGGLGRRKGEKKTRGRVALLSLQETLGSLSAPPLPLPLNTQNAFRPRIPASLRAHHHGCRAPPRLRGCRPCVGFRARGEARRPRRWPGR